MQITLILIKEPWEPPLDISNFLSGLGGHQPLQPVGKRFCHRQFDMLVVWLAFAFLLPEELHMFRYALIIFRCRSKVNTMPCPTAEWFVLKLFMTFEVLILLFFA